jgi:hypothetical protein
MDYFFIARNKCPCQLVNVETEKTFQTQFAKENFGIN